ncbi:hypothetical protein, partial [Granulicella mallensis]|uniref:hypothetical protein n=1 Tax=Granulicella mallensis TaxID=940614 RepID=UPI001C85AEA4
GLHGVSSSGWIICASSTYQEGTPLFIPSERSTSRFCEVRSRRTPKDSTLPTTSGPFPARTSTPQNFMDGISAKTGDDTKPQRGDLIPAQGVALGKPPTEHRAL